MKKIIIATAFIASSLCIHAQEPMGGGGFGGGRPPMGNFDEDNDEDQATEVVKFPEIPNLTDKQRQKMISEVVKEHDAIAKLEKEKRTLFEKNMKGVQMNGQHPQGRPNDSIRGKKPQGMPPPRDRQRFGGDSIHGKMHQKPEEEMGKGGRRLGGTQMQHLKLSEKDQKKVDKIQKNEDKVYAKADKKYSSILMKEQYAVFKEKKKEIQFNSPNNDNKRQGNRQRRMNDNGGGGAPPDMTMGGGGGF